MKKILALIVALMFALTVVTVVSACSLPKPSITLSPPQGFASVTIVGTGFEPQKTVTITYDGAVQPTVPLSVQTDGSGSFSAIISVPDELAVGNHTIAASDAKGDSASANFTVVNMKGPQGAQGVQGPQGVQGTSGVAGQNGQDFNSTGNVFVYNGTDGVNGQGGLNGTNGTNGVNGTDGVNGLDFNATGTEFVYNGTDGLNGQNGVNGINGLNGKDGTNGINGTNGTDGKDATSGQQGVTEKVIYMNDPFPTGGFDLNFIWMLVIALVAVAVTMLIASHKSKKQAH